MQRRERIEVGHALPDRSWYASAVLLLGVLVIYALSSTSRWTDDTDCGRLV